MKNKTTNFIILIVLLAFHINAHSQENVGIGTTTPEVTALLDLVASDKGLLVPRLTTANRDAIAAPATGLLIYNTSNNRFEYYTGATWVPILTNGIISLDNSRIFVGNASNIATGVVLSGDATITNTGVLTIANDAITTAKISDTQVTNAKLATAIDATKLADGSVDNTEFQYLNGVTSNIQTQLDSKVSGTLLNTNIFVGNASNLATGVAMSGDAVISNAGVVTIANDAITTAKIGNTQVTNAKLATGIDATKLADGSVDNTEFQYLNGVTSNIQTQLDSKVSGTLLNTNIFVGNASNIATGVAMSGDATISNAGVLTIGNDAITTAKIGNTQVTNAKLASGIDATKLADGSVDNTEFQYLDGATSNIQTQLNAKMTNALTNTNIFVGDASNVATGVAMSGDATISNAGVLTIGNDAITTAKIGNTQVTNAKLASGIDATKLADGSVDNTEFQYLDGATSNIQTQLNAKMTNALTNTNIFVGDASNVATGVAMSGDATISNTGVLTIGNDAITTSKIGNTQVTNAKLASGIDATKLADGSVDNTEFQYLDGATSNIQTQLNAKMTNALTNTNIFVGDASNVATGVAMSGDATISNAGVLTIGNDAITTAKIIDNAVDGEKIQISGNTTGSMMYYDGTDWVQLSPGVSGQLLQTSGAAAPTWVNAPSGSLPPGSDKQTIRHNGTDWVVSSNLSNDGTNIGVGISTPTALVHQDGGDATAAYHKFTAGTTTGTTASDGFNIGVSSGGTAELRQLESSDMIFATNDTERMRLFANGKLSINTTSAPDDSVQVLINGDVRITQDLIVDGNIDPIALILQPQTTAPNISTKGTIYFDNTSNDIKFYNGSTWTTFGAVVNDDQDVTGNVSLLNSGTASELRFYEPSGDGNNFTAFKARSQNSDISYNLPVSQGAADSYLKNDGSGNLSWGTVSASNTLSVTHLTGRDDYNVGSSDQVIVASFTGGDKNIYLPSAASNAGRVIYLRKVISSAYRIILFAQEGELIDGYATRNVTLDGARTVVSDGSNWWIISF
jgi:uncharacterized protein YifE (UPF0438 family)